MRFLSSEKLSEHKYKTPEGYLICTDAILARTGKQTYRKNEVFADAEDDSEIEVDRRPEDVFSNETMASFENKPITVEHPDTDVNAENHNELAVGFARDIRRATINGQDVMVGNLVITDAKTIEEIENGEHTELSCGYDCDINDENNPVQKNIRGNHIALCERGRAGIARIVDSVVKDGKYYITNSIGNYVKAIKYGDVEETANKNEALVYNNRDEAENVRKNYIKLATLYKVVNDSVKDSVYAIKYKRYNIIGINTFEIDAKDVYDALRQFERHVIENAWGTANVNIISVSPNDGDMRLYGQLSKLLKEHTNDSERRVYTFEYQEKKTGKIHNFRCTAPDAEEARNQLQEWAAEHDEEPYKILSTNMIYDSSVKDVDSFVYYKGFVFDDGDENAPQFNGFDKEKVVQKIKGHDLWIVYKKNGLHSDVYNLIKGKEDGFTVTIEPGKITIDKLHKYPEVNPILVKAAKDIEHTNNVVFNDSVKDSYYEFDGNQFDVDELNNDATNHNLDCFWTGYQKIYKVKGKRQDIINLLHEYNMNYEIRNIKDSAINDSDSEMDYITSHKEAMRMFNELINVEDVEPEKAKRIVYKYFNKEIKDADYKHWYIKGLVNGKAVYNIVNANSLEEAKQKFIKKYNINNVEYINGMSEDYYNEYLNKGINVLDELIQSESEEAFKKNIATEIKAGKDPKQAAAIAYSVQRANDSIIKDGTCKVSSNDFGVATMFGPKSKEELERLARANEKVYLEYEVNGKGRGFWKAASSLLRQLNSGTMRIIKVYDSAIKDSLKKFEIYEDNNITLIRAKDLTDAIKKFKENNK